jgi:hypothetical protein
MQLGILDIVVNLNMKKVKVVVICRCALPITLHLKEIKCYTKDHHKDRRMKKDLKKIDDNPKVKW